MTFFVLPSRQLATHHILDADAPAMTQASMPAVDFTFRPLTINEVLQTSESITPTCRVDDPKAGRNANRPLAKREQTAITLGQRLRPYFGTLHSHTAESDGRGQVSEAYAMARDEAKLDFFAVTDHAENWLFWKDETYRRQKEQADKAQAPGFVTLYGFEYSHPYYGHYTVLNAQHAHHAFEDYGIPDFYAWLKAPDQADALVMFAHPGFHDYRVDSEFDHFALDPDLVDRFVGMETIHWNEYLRYFRGYFGLSPYIDEAIKIGWRPGAVGSQDVHYADWGTRDTTRVVSLMPDLSRESLLTALKARHFYATTNRDLYFAVNLLKADGNWAQMGDKVKQPEVQLGALTLKVRYYDADCLDDPRRLELVLDGRVVGSYDFPVVAGAFNAAGEVTVQWRMDTLPLQSHALYVRFYQGKGPDNYTQSSPIFLEAM